MESMGFLEGELIVLGIRPCKKREEGAGGGK